MIFGGIGCGHAEVGDPFSYKVLTGENHHRRGNPQRGNIRDARKKMFKRMIFFLVSRKWMVGDFYEREKGFDS